MDDAFILRGYTERHISDQVTNAVHARLNPERNALKAQLAPFDAELRTLYPTDAYALLKGKQALAPGEPGYDVWTRRNEIVRNLNDLEARGRAETRAEIKTEVLLYRAEKPSGGCEPAEQLRGQLEDLAGRIEEVAESAEDAQSNTAELESRIEALEAVIEELRTHIG
ncbi:MAG: DUF4349 domain-containing protein [Oscillospiraceae bacterium]|jgi:DNA repair exonuclease SbcCD ATPase subunit|nr:DUF4349 domain-containing protein [Oscillospiraceae bacterium]